MPARRHEAPILLMTGANGFVGRHLRAAISARIPTATVVPVDIKGGEGAHRVDLRAPEAVDALIAETRPDVIVHLAAQASVARSDQAGTAVETMAVNVGGSLNLALAVARHAPQARLLFSSSAEVYGESLRDGPVTEGSRLQPVNLYARTKVLGEAIFEAALPASTSLVIARPFNHTGPGQREDFVLPSFVGQIARMEAGLQPPRLRVGNLEARRDFIDVRDVVAAYVALLGTSDLPDRFCCNVGSGRPSRSIGEIVESLKGLAAIPFDVVVEPGRLRAVDVPVVEGKTRVLQEATGWRPRISMDETLRDMLEQARAALAGLSAPIA